MKVKGRQNYKPGPKDECGTPPYAVLPILTGIEWYRYSLGLRKDEFVVLEPAIGMLEHKHHTGIVEGLEVLGYRVFSLAGEDFLSMDIDEVNSRCKAKYDGLKIRMIVTNPPFSVALKRRFINKCESLWVDRGLPYALLMNTTTLTERINGKTLRSCAVHIPYSRICFNMPNKGWGTPEKPTKPTFTTNWFSKGIACEYSINYDDFDMSDHFNALKRFGGGFWSR